MLLKLSDYRMIDPRKLMDVYSESNFENTDYFCPDETDKEAAVSRVESGFLQFLKDDFYRHAKAVCWVFEEDGVWISALRTCEIRPGLYYLEALETRPDRRRKGYGSALLSGVLEELKTDGPFRLCDCVGKRNTASLKTHEKCGFRVVSDRGYDYLSGESDDRVFGLEYRYPEAQRASDRVPQAEKKA